jgi:hypothetical protein
MSKYHPVIIRSDMIVPVYKIDRVVLDEEEVCIYLRSKAMTPVEPIISDLPYKTMLYNWERACSSL